MSTMMPPPRHGRHGPVRRCMHCEKDIELMGNGTWVDSDGIGVCVKYTGQLTPGETPPYILHTPLPEIK